MHAAYVQHHLAHAGELDGVAEVVEQGLRQPGRVPAQQVAAAARRRDAVEVDHDLDLLVAHNSAQLVDDQGLGRFARKEAELDGVFAVFKRPLDLLAQPGQFRQLP